MNLRMTPYTWLDWIVAAFLAGFGWAAGTWFFSALAALVG